MRARGCIETLTPKTIMLDGKYVDAKNTPYDGNITLAPFTSALVMKPPPS